MELIMENISNILKNFSFSEAESALYAAALKLQKTGISEIAQKADMGRTVAYFHIKNLVERGILRQISQGKKIIVSPIPPAELAQLLQKNVGDFKSLVPQLENLSTIENEIPQIEIMESNQAFKKIYDEVTNMTGGSIFKVIEDKAGAEAELKLLDNEYWNYFFGQIAERKIVTKAIFTKELLADINQSITPENYALVQKRMWNIRTLSEENLQIKNLVVLYNKKLSFLFPEISLTITIKHNAFFNLFDALFETIFNLSEKVDQPWSKK